MDDKLTKYLVRIAAGIFILITLGAGAYFAWWHFAYQQALKECTMGVSADTLRILEEIKAHSASDCMARKGFHAR